MPESVVLFFAQNPLLLLFVVVALGYPLGKLRVAGASLGIASILFAGIAMGALVVVPQLDPALKKGLTSEMKFVYELGLSIFVYAMGLAIAHSFWSAFSREGIKKNATVLIVMLVSALAILGVARFLAATGLFDCNSRYAAGLLAGSFTNMPALAGVIETLKRQGADALAVAQPTVASAIAYPIGVVVPMLAVVLSRRCFKVDLQAEARSLRHYHPGHGRLTVTTLEVTGAGEGMTHADLRGREGCQVVFGCLSREGKIRIAPLGLPLRAGDLLMVVGSREEVGRAVRILGREAEVSLQHDISRIDAARVFVSNADTIGRPLRELQLPERYEGIITRLRRGDRWFVPDADTVLELGDRIRVVTRKDNLSAIEALFGDSYQELSEASFVVFALGLAAGLVLGRVPIPLGHGITLSLGFAGGPLVVGLVLGRHPRCGTFVWNLPYSANHTIRQFGLALFAAGIGIISGEGFRFILGTNLAVLPVFAAAALGVLVLADGLACWIGYRLFRIPLNVLFGIVAGMHTQPVVLGYATQQTRNELPNVGFAAVYPLATILKIVLAQVLLVLAA